MTMMGDSFSAQDSGCYVAKMKEIILIEQRAAAGLVGATGE
jgi:hypothetical protein